MTAISFFLFFLIAFSTAKLNDWTWVHGPQTIGPVTSYPPYNYGELLVPSPDNLPPPRYGAATWSVGNNKHYMLGGLHQVYSYYYSYYLFADLWEFDIDLLQYTHVGGSNETNVNSVCGSSIGIPSNNNSIGARRSMVHWHVNGEHYFLGGRGYDCASNTNYLNDLWKFNGKFGNESLWTMLGGQNGGKPNAWGTKFVPSEDNWISGRYESMFFYDSTKNIVFIYGGTGIDSYGSNSMLGDLWQYDVTNGLFTWIGGSSDFHSKWDYYQYGQKGVPHRDNWPPVRSVLSFWTIDSSTAIMFGGYYSMSCVSENQYKYLFNDLWKLKISKRYDRVHQGTWTWLGGRNKAIPDRDVTYADEVCVAWSNTGQYMAPYNHSHEHNWPGGRYWTANFHSSDGQLYLLAGRGRDNGTWNYDSGNDPDYANLNDLWRLNLQNLTWIFMHGSKEGYVNGIYGTFQNGSHNNQLGSRDAIQSWVYKKGNENFVLLFSGWGCTNESCGEQRNYLSDTWIYSFPDLSWNPPKDHSSDFSFSYFVFFTSIGGSFFLIIGILVLVSYIKYSKIKNSANSPFFLLHSILVLFSTIALIFWIIKEMFNDSIRIQIILIPSFYAASIFLNLILVLRWCRMDQPRMHDWYSSHKIFSFLIIFLSIFVNFSIIRVIYCGFFQSEIFTAPLEKKNASSLSSSTYLSSFFQSASILAISFYVYPSLSTISYEFYILLATYSVCFVYIIFQVFSFLYVGGGTGQVVEDTPDKPSWLELYVKEQEEESRVHSQRFNKDVDFKKKQIHRTTEIETLSSKSDLSNESVEDKDTLELPEASNKKNASRDSTPVSSDNIM